MARALRNVVRSIAYAGPGLPLEAPEEVPEPIACVEAQLYPPARVIFRRSDLDNALYLIRSRCSKCPDQQEQITDERLKGLDLKRNLYARRQRPARALAALHQERYTCDGAGPTCPER